MANPILQALSGASQQISNSSNNPLSMIQRFAEFKKQLGNRNPQQIVQELLNSGKMSQAQFEQLKQQAQSLQNILK